MFKQKILSGWIAKSLLWTQIAGVMCLLAVSVYSVVYNAAHASATSFDLAKVSIYKGKTKETIFVFDAEIADDENARATGLMFREKLPKNQAMLFKFNEDKGKDKSNGESKADGESVVYMWMKNVKFPLDMLFIDEYGRIVNIYKNAQPNSHKIISSLLPVSMVLEINGTMADKLGIEIGDRVMVK